MIKSCRNCLHKEKTLSQKPCDRCATSLKDLWKEREVHNHKSETR